MPAALPLVLAGPTLRHCDQDNFTLWLVSSKPMNELTLTLAKKKLVLQQEQCHEVQLGEKAWQYLIQVEQKDFLCVDSAIAYELTDSQHGALFSSIQQLNYQDKKNPEFVIKPQIDNLLHGSCRNPHHHSGDALVAADTRLSQDLSIEARPSLLMLSGDQVYVDDIAGPMIYAIGEVIKLLGLPQEKFNDAALSGSAAISYHPAALYQRQKNLLPKTQYQAKTAIRRWYINHPIFTSSLAENHLITLGEIIALYLLTWSPELWDQIEIPKEVAGLSVANNTRWNREWLHLLEFKAGLQQVRRLMAHLPTYMIFDDHDVTDDWNLTAKWEQAAYGHPFSKRIIGNALIGYALFQGLGNAPKKFKAQITPLIDAHFSQPDEATQDRLIDELLKFEHWHYTLKTSPKLVVLDTRTHRWRSESNLAKPSGLMDWESLMELQQELVGQSNVIIVSAAPMFGVKLIETVQRTATMLGGSLLVDAENWMAHPGTANTLLSIFQHRKTPEQFVILSGDVHYSFAYDIRIRFRKGGPKIYQITCSGLKNQFPEKLIPIFDKINGWLYGHFSPLNFFTKRKRMSIRGRRPNGARSKRLMNQSGIGMLDLAKNGAPTKIAVLHTDMSETHFDSPRKE
ncbi:alkaline phosphatase family protein [Shewanella eurypsychrophilus]|uniref:Alkaline phosphatase family protein n=1 Tax=Shewanella eurypsychrophilus TaxID=2593656 RepID=A0ABX6VER1_9GAMM|nr:MULTISPECIES: alkaline phosphatase D family protein [Shewanella]QFU25164.1 alkaline phosphatase family protein [Shewanella sp. YLB-09]QPG60314.1 alkaline phosphatase family protein [Shewanella eurypsychrophilus]